MKFTQKPMVLFDMDGTLLDTRHDIALAANKARSELGMPALSVDEVVRAVGDGLAVFVSRVIYPQTDSRFAAAKEVFLRHYAQNVTVHTKPYDGIEELLVELTARGFVLGVVSNKPEQLVGVLVKHFGWEKFFRCWLGGDSASRPKPAPDPLWLALERAGFSKKHPLVMVGDGHQDIESAKAAGGRAVWCAWGLNDTRPTGFDGDTAESPASVLRHLTQDP